MTHAYLQTFWKYISMFMFCVASNWYLKHSYLLDFHTYALQMTLKIMFVVA